MKQAFDINAQKPVFSPREFFHGRSIDNFLNVFAPRSPHRNTFQQIAADNNGLDNEQTGPDTASVFSDLKDALKTHGLMHPADLIQNLAEKYNGPNSPIIKPITDHYEQTHQVDPVTHYLPKECSDFISGLAHIHAKENNADVAIFECDFMNLGGTNYEFFKRALAEKYEQNIISTEDIQILDGLNKTSFTDKQLFEELLGRQSEKLQKLYHTVNAEAFDMTDRVMGALTLTTAKVIQDNTDQPDKVFPLRTGGDEFRILAEGIPSEKIEAIQQQIYAEQTTILQAVGLTHHLHPKKANQHGTGNAVSGHNMRTHFNHTTFLTSVDPQIEHSKTLFVQNFLNKKEENNLSQADIKSYLSAQTENLQQSLNYLQRDIPPAIKIDRRYPFEPPHISLVSYAKKRIESIGASLTDYETRCLRQAIFNAAPQDSATDTYSGKDVEQVIENYITETRDLNAERSQEINNTLSASLTVIDTKNLGGLNKAFSHVGADIVLRDISQTIKKALDSNEIYSGRGYYLAHKGGGQFLLVQPPIKLRGKIDDHKNNEIVTEETHKMIAAHIQDRVAQINALSPQEYFKNKQLNLDDLTNNKFDHMGDTPSAHGGNNAGGIQVDISVHKLKPSPNEKSYMLLKRILEAHKNKTRKTARSMQIQTNDIA